MQRRRSVEHPGRSGSDWGTLVNAFQRGSLSVDLSSSAAGSRHAITAGSLTSSLMSDCRMRSAWGPRRLRAVGFRAYMTRHEPRLLGTRGPFNRDHFFPCFFLQTREKEISRNLTLKILSSKRVRALESCPGCNNLPRDPRSPALRSLPIARKSVQTRGG